MKNDQILARFGGVKTDFSRILPIWSDFRRKSTNFWLILGVLKSDFWLISGLSSNYSDFFIKSDLFYGVKRAGDRGCISD